MAAGTVTPYENGILNLLDGTTDFLTDTIRAALILAAYTPDVAVHDFWDDVSANETADADYTVQVLGSKTLTIVSNKPVFDAAQVDYGAAVTITAKYLVLYHWSGVAGTSPLLWYVDLNTAGGSAASTASDFKVDFNAAGIYRITP